MRLGIALRRTGEALLSLLYPPHCASCQCSTPAGEHLCGKCRETARRITAPFCHTCSQPFDGEVPGEFVCANCTGREFHFACAVAAYRSRDVVREFIHRFKYDRHFYLRHSLADWLADALQDERITAHPVDFLVPVPLHSARERDREFNQADVLAALLSERAKVPVLRCLERIRYTTTQTRLDRQERMENLRGAFRVRQTPAVLNRHLLIVDDVLTTGSTVDECARVLRLAGAASVRVVTVARG
ncbi:MAG TPA: ComF family protein [Chthoniobacteraceae bacterium]|jgi:ComF family protein